MRKHRYICLGALLVIVQGCSTFSGSGTVAGKLAYEGGSPIKNAHISINAPGQYGRPIADDSGAFSFPSIAAGIHTVDFHCPSETAGPGRLIEQRKILLKNSETLFIEVTTPDGYCYEPPYSKRSIVVDGFFSHGFESSNLVVCDSEKLALTENTFFEKPYIWVRLTPGIKNDLESDTLYRIQAKGILKGPGNYGHMGVSEYGFDMEDLISFQSAEGLGCN